MPICVRVPLRVHYTVFGPTLQGLNTLPNPSRRSEVPGWARTTSSTDCHELNIANNLHDSPKQTDNAVARHSRNRGNII